ncbi:unnamed protein product [Phytophthora fragariaefolia]|uniref:Unnamed protein product n=1 Tax=Phytophthora fragariaefolia TaxID=1490495 RepID=A0A9W6X823_9STRA|nr:unnamed protein product [Phytophthora fragariaefolia]
MEQPSRRLPSLSSAAMAAPARSDRSASCRSSTRSAASSESSANAGVAPVSNSSAFTLASSSSDGCNFLKDEEPQMTRLRRPESTRNSPIKPVSPAESVDLAAYYTFSRRNSKIVHDDTQGLSGFLEYRKLNGTWRPFLFQTIGHQLVLYRVHVRASTCPLILVLGGLRLTSILSLTCQSTHQVLVMSTDIRSASEIVLDYEGTKGSCFPAESLM